MKRTKALVAFAIASVMASCAMPAFAATTSPPTVDNAIYAPVDRDNLVINDKTTALRGSMPAAKKLGDGLGVPITFRDLSIPKADGISAMFEPILVKPGTGIIGLQNSERMKIYIFGNNGARAAPTASMGKFDDMSAARLGDKNYYNGKAIGGGSSNSPA